MDLEPVLETIPKILATHTGKMAYNYLASRVKERIERNWELMRKDMCEKATPDAPLRNDWFAENEVLNNCIPFRLLEKTIREISNDSQERKSEYVAKFWVNVCLTSNADIDEATAFSYFEAIESLSWRQLCIIRLVILARKNKVSMCRVIESDVERMPKDQQTSYHSISRDFEKLRNDGYYQSVASLKSEETNEPLLDLPTASPNIPDHTRRLHSLMNLNKIPMPDIVKTFSPWKVRPKKLE